PAEAQPRLETVGAGDRRAQQGHEGVDETMVLHQVAGHRRVVDVAAAQFADEAVLDRPAPRRLAGRAQARAETWFHHEDRPRTRAARRAAGAIVGQWTASVHVPGACSAIIRP